MEALFSDIDSLKLYAGVHKKVFGYHRLLSKRFPYAVYYSLENKLIAMNRNILAKVDQNDWKNDYIIREIIEEYGKEE